MKYEARRQEALFKGDETKQGRELNKKEVDEWMQLVCYTAPSFELRRSLHVWELAERLHLFHWSDSHLKSSVVSNAKTQNPWAAQ